MSLLQLIFVVVDFNACIVFLVISGISWTYALMCSNIVVIMMAIAYNTCYSEKVVTFFTFSSNLTLFLAVLYFWIFIKLCTR